MKTTLYLLLAVFALPMATAPAFAEGVDPAARKEAVAWAKTSQDKHKKALGILKKVKNVKSAKAAAKKLDKMFGSIGEKTAMGEVAPPQAPDSALLEEVAASRVEKIRELSEEIAKEVDRILELNLECSELSAALDAMNEGLEAP